MWWIVIPIVLIVIGLIVGFAVLIVYTYNRGDYGDGGGNTIGGNNNVSFFAPKNERAGVWGENFANYHLRPLLRNDEYLMGNLLFTFKDGRFSEIDCVLVSRKGIFCIETKRWVGHITGNDTDEQWLQVYDDPRMDDRYHSNPVKQNSRHCMLLKKFLHNRYYIHNIVIFVGLEDGEGIESNNAFTISKFKDYYRKLESNVLGLNQIKSAYETLLPHVASKENLKKYRSKSNV